MRPLAEIIEFLRTLSPLHLATEWDNVGLLVGDPAAAVGCVVTCLTLSSDVAAEATRREAQLVVTHHPVLFRPVQRITSDTIEGRVLLGLIQAGIAVYSAHTAYDSARDGINQQLAELLELQNIAPLRPLLQGSTSTSTATGSSLSDDPQSGSGRFGTLPRPVPFGELVQTVKARLGIDHAQFAGDAAATVERLGIACGSAAEFLHDARRLGCQALLTGEARFHAALEARELGLGLILAGHYATEQPAMRQLADALSKQFADLTVWASETETDPVQWA